MCGPHRIPTASEKKKAIDVAYQFFTNERDYPMEGRRAAAERVCVPLMKSCDEVALREFFLDHVGDIMTIIEASLSKVHRWCLHSILMCLYIYLYTVDTGASVDVQDVLFQLHGGALPATALWSTQQSRQQNQQGLLQGQHKKWERIDPGCHQVRPSMHPFITGEVYLSVCRAGHLAKGEDLHGDRSLVELRRQYHCAAFNMVTAVITCTQKDLKFYTSFLFREDFSKVNTVVCPVC